MATRPPVSMPQLSKRSRFLLILGGLVVVALLAGTQLLGTYVDWLWYGEVEARSVFSTILLTRIALFFAVGIVVAGIVALGLFLAYRTRPVFVPVAAEDDPLANYRSTIVGRARWFGIGIPVVIGLIAGATAQADWAMVRLFFGGTAFGETDPEFGRDIGFYAFSLPFYNWLVSLFLVATALAFIAAAIVHYVFGGIRVGGGAGKTGQFSNAAKVQLAVTAGIFVLFLAVNYFLNRYDILQSDRKSEVFYGATATDLDAVLPAQLILMSIAVFCALALFAGAVLRNLQLPAIALALLLVSGVVVGTAWPALLEQFSVQPNEIARESDSIERNMAATERAYGLDEVEHIPYAGQTQASDEEVAQDLGVIPNIRLLDPSVLEPTFTQQTAQEIYYGYPDELDIDRYEIDGERQDYIVGLREVDTDNLPPQQQNWNNRHMVFTHGDGITMAPANRIDRAVQDEEGGEGGFPVFGRSDSMDPDGSGIEVEQPRSYYGELMTDYAIVGPDGPGEIDADGSADYTYTGEGGVSIGDVFHRSVFAAHFGERNILFSTDLIGDDSKIMYKRNPVDRVRDKAPFLTIDNDPYPAVVDGRIKWIVDGYTTMDNYPYSEQQPLGEVIEDPITGMERPDQNTINYISNSVKATVDAYDGTVTLYEQDTEDPVLQAWQNVFPDLVEPNEAISDELREHFRYPEDLFAVQRELYTRYHVDDPTSFFQASGYWDVPPDPRPGIDEPDMPPYYLFADTPGYDRETFQLTSPMVPLQRQFLASWMSVSSEPESYGEIKMLDMGVDEDPGAESQQAAGPVQVQNRFDSDEEFAQDRTLFDNPQVEVIYGNQLTLPVADGFLYVEPIYTQQTGENPFPQLSRVLVNFGDTVGFASTLEGALEDVFGPEAADIASSVEEGDVDVDSPEASDEQPQEDAPPEDTEEQQAPDEGEASGETSELQEAAADMQEAFSRYQEAQSNGDYEAQGQALADLDDAAQRLEEAQSAQEGEAQPGG